VVRIKRFFRFQVNIYF